MYGHNIPAMDEVHTFLYHIVENRADGSSGILPGMVKVCSNKLLMYLVKLFTHIQYEIVGVFLRMHALLIPVPKKGDLLLCYNWQGISLLEVFGMVRTFQNHSEEAASNCGRCCCRLPECILIRSWLC